MFTMIVSAETTIIDTGLISQTWLDLPPYEPGGYNEMSFILAWLTNSSLIYEPKCRGRWVIPANDYTQLYTGAQINFEDLTP
jgi:hypothetical protein